MERATDRTPDKKSFYVFVGNEMKGEFRNRKDAQDFYASILKASGFAPPPQEPGRSRNEAVERYLDDVEAYWEGSHKHTRRGGKGRF
jgi:hypothetical protein